MRKCDSLRSTYTFLDNLILTTTVRDPFSKSLVGKCAPYLLLADGIREIWWWDTGGEEVLN